MEKVHVPEEYAGFRVYQASSLADMLASRKAVVLAGKYSCSGDEYTLIHLSNPPILSLSLSL